MSRPTRELSGLIDPGEPDQAHTKGPRTYGR